MIIDPNNFDKRSNLDECLGELVEYSSMLGLEMPNITVGPYESAYSKWSARGMYVGRERRIYVDLKHCKPAAKNPGFSWSYTGYKADMTPAGVLAHEFGHYIDDARSIVKPRRQRIGELHDAEGCVSSYHPNPHEWFAETFRVFFLNPHLLWCGKPRTFDFMRLECGLTLSRRSTWQEIMVNAHPRFMGACRTFVSAGLRDDLSSWHEQA